MLLKTCGVDVVLQMACVQNNEIVNFPTKQ